MKTIMICPRCGKANIRYKRPLGNPFAEGIWTCFSCAYQGKRSEFGKTEIGKKPKVK